MKKKLLIALLAILGIVLVLSVVPAVIDCGESVLYHSKEDMFSVTNEISGHANFSEAAASIQGCIFFIICIKQKFYQKAN